MFLIGSGYKTQIQNMDDLFASGIKLAYAPEYSFIIENCDKTEALKFQCNHVNCPSHVVCANWVKYQKNISIFFC